MLLAQDSIRTSSSLKEEKLKYHLSQMKYYFECARNECDEVTISLSNFYRHKEEAEALQESLEASW